MLVIILILFALFVYALYEYRNIQKVTLTRDDFNITQKHDLKIVYLSDFQYDLSDFYFNHRLMKKVVKLVNEENPDLVLLGGDYIHKKGNQYPVFDYLKQIDAPKIGVLGNHDYKDVENVIKKCKEAKIKLLVNQTTKFKDINIIGLDDLRDGHPKLPHYHKDEFNLLLIHEPDDFENYITNDHFDITLAGHHHAGQINFFGLYAPIVPSIHKQRYLHGLITRNNRKIYVSSGLGGWVFFLPIRFFAKPEIVILEI